VKVPPEKTRKFSFGLKGEKLKLNWVSSRRMPIKHTANPRRYGKMRYPTMAGYSITMELMLAISRIMNPTMNTELICLAISTHIRVNHRYYIKFFRSCVLV
jgi:hypothetical protein